MKTKNSVREITWLLWRHLCRTVLFSKCFPSTVRRKAAVFKFLLFEERLRKAPFSWRITVLLTVDIELLFNISSAYFGPAPSARIYELMRAQKNPPTTKNEAYELVICCNAFENNEARWYSPRREPKPLNEQEMKFVSTLTSWCLESSIYAHDNDKISDHPSQKMTVASRWRKGKR